jgi:ribosomal protein S18 acetylase RimI-like enzyme
MIETPGLSPQNAAAACALRRGTVADLPALRFVDPLMRADCDRAHLVRSSVEKSECWIAVDQDEVLGFVLLGELLGQRFIPLLVVAAGDRRRGVGTSLLNQAAIVCTRPKLFISCNRSNLPAQGLFEKCGFVPSGRLWNLDIDDDELFFVKFVSAEGKTPIGGDWKDHVSIAAVPVKRSARFRSGG